MAAHNTKGLSFDTREFSVYEGSDLRYFQQILDQAYKELWDQSAAKEDEGALKTRMAIALFKCAGTGERDYDRLKQCAASAVLDGTDAEPADRDGRSKIKTTVSMRVVEN